MTLRTARIPLVIQAMAWSDDWSFWKIGVPAISATDTAFLRNDHYRDVSDTPATLDYHTMADAVGGLRYVVEALGQGAVWSRDTIPASSLQPH